MFTRWLHNLAVALHLTGLKVTVTLADKATDKAYAEFLAARKRDDDAKRAAEQIVERANQDFQAANVAWSDRAVAGSATFKAAQEEATLLRPGFVLA
jgi:hypothetical protein